jgi:hypothetical protein
MISGQPPSVPPQVPSHHGLTFPIVSRISLEFVGEVCIGRVVAVAICDNDVPVVVAPYLTSLALKRGLATVGKDDIGIIGQGSTGSLYIMRIILSSIHVSR